MIKTSLKIISFLMVIMGVATLNPSWLWANGATWLGVVQVVIGVVGIAIAYSDKAN